MQKLLFIFCCVLIGQQAIAQTAANYHLQIYTTDNGLPSNGIKGMQWDEKTEFLWMATEAGIVRFNGVDFKSYTKENMPGIASERLLFMIRNNAGRIYTSDQPGNIFSIDKSKPVLWKKSASSASINPFLSNYYLLAASDTFFKKNAAVTNASPFSAGIDKIVCISDTAFLIISRGRLYYHTISLQAPQPLPFETETFNAAFKIEHNYFVTNSKKEVYLFNISNQSLTPVTVTASGYNTIDPAIKNGSFFFGKPVWLIPFL